MVVDKGKDNAIINGNPAPPVDTGKWAEQVKEAVAIYEIL